MRYKLSLIYCPVIYWCYLKCFSLCFAIGLSDSIQQLWVIVVAPYAFWINLAYTCTEDMVVFLFVQIPETLSYYIISLLHQCLIFESFTPAWSILILLNPVFTESGKKTCLILNIRCNISYSHMDMTRNDDSSFSFNLGSMELCHAYWHEANLNIWYVQIN